MTILKDLQEVEKIFMQMKVRHFKTKVVFIIIIQMKIAHKRANLQKEAIFKS